MNPELIDCLKYYNKRDLAKDLTAGLLVAIIALPLSIALGIQSGGTLQQGILTAIIAGLSLSLFGGSRFQIASSTTAFVVIILNYINDPNIGLVGLSIVTICVGVILILMGIFKVGKLIKFVPYPVVVGFTFGVGITLLVSQLKDFLGLSLPFSEYVWQKLYHIGLQITSTNWIALLLGVLTIAIIMLLPKLTKKIPSTFVAIIFITLLSTSLTAIFGDKLGIQTIGSVYGNIKAEFNFNTFVGIGNIKISALISPIIVITFLGAIETLLSSRVADKLTNTKHNPNRELIGQGIGNIASSLLCGLPVTGAIARTSANINYGAKSPLAGVFHSIFLLLMYLLLMPILKFVPLTCLAGILITVSKRMANFKAFANIFKSSPKNAIILVVTALLTICLNLTYGILGGLALTLILKGTLSDMKKFKPKKSPSTVEVPAQTALAQNSQSSETDNKVA